MTFVHAGDAKEFLQNLEDESVDLLLTDPPYFGIVENDWDNKWESEADFARWLSDIFLTALPKLTPTGSLVFFGAMGKHKIHPLFRVVPALEDGGYTYRNWLTWKKRRAYGKSHDYLYTREEILWFSKSPDRTSVTFNIPLLDTLRGYTHIDYKKKNKDGKQYEAKSPFLRVSNVWTDIDPIIEETEIMGKKEHICQKPPKLMERLIATHSNEGQLVVDPFCGSGSTGVSAVTLRRRFLGSEAMPEEAVKADARIAAALQPEGALALF